jgi:hypothetical protein
MKKSHIYIFVLFLFSTFCQNKITEAQSQSMLLPIPCTSSSVINFTDYNAPIISTLPAHDFTYNNAPGDPHDEQQIHYPDNTSINEKYLGQHPMYAQQVAHDKDGKTS